MNLGEHTLFLFAIAVAFILAAPRGALTEADGVPAQGVQNRTSLKVSAKNGAVGITFECPATLFSGKENSVRVTLQNDGDEPVQYTEFSPLEGVTFEVKRGDSDVPPTQLYDSWTSGVITRLPKIYSLQKGQKVDLLFNFTRLFDISVPGQYEISASWTGWLPTTKAKVPFKTDPIKVTVTAEDPKPPK